MKEEDVGGKVETLTSGRFGENHARPERLTTQEVFCCLVALVSNSLCFISETVKTGIVSAEYGEDDSDPEDDINDKFTDLSIMACLLCKRQFPNKEALERHQKFSDLHKVMRAR